MKTAEQLEELLRVYPPDVEWLANMFHTHGEVVPLDLWMLGKARWGKAKTGLYALYVEKPVKKSWASDRNFVYVGISKNIKKRWDKHEPWIRKLVFSDEHLRSASDRSRFWFCYYECEYDRAKEIETYCWSKKHQLGLSFLQELQ